MSEYHAAVGLAELDGWPSKHAALMEVTRAYRRAAAAVGVADRLTIAPEIATCYSLYRCADAKEATAAFHHLEAAQADTRLWYGLGLHRHAHFAGRVSCDDLPVTDRVAPLTIGLPIAIDLADADIGRIVEALSRGIGASHSRR
jgi:dTDP-4-amino-4,6-dideoxygalactose transaminase